MFSQIGWALFFILVSVAVTVDLFTSLKSSSQKLAKRAGWMSACWFMLALAFAGVVYYIKGLEESALFIAGYFVELALSVDNIFVFILVFDQFKIRESAQHKVLIIGVLSAIIMRLLMISAGIALIKSFQWVFYIFGFFLIYTGIKLLQDNKDSNNNDRTGNIIEYLKKFLPFTDGDHGNAFVVKINGKRFLTQLTLVLVIIEQVDLIFALDSIPAILAITDDLFIVFTSNIFAVMGLRSMYFFLSNVLKKFVYIKHALSLILCFIGLKMIASTQGFHIPIGVSLSVIIASIVIAVAFSMLKHKKKVNNKA